MFGLSPLVTKVLLIGAGVGILIYAANQLADVLEENGTLKAQVDSATEKLEAKALQITSLEESLKDKGEALEEEIANNAELNQILGEQKAASIVAQQKYDVLSAKFNKSLQEARRDPNACVNAPLRPDFVTSLLELYPHAAP